MLVDEFLVCPRSKQPLSRSGSDYVAPCGFKYRNGDFRVQLDFTSQWEETQREYETWLEKWREEGDTIPGRLDAIDAEVSDVYSEIALDGLVLDVAGDIGTVVSQAGIDPQRYVSLDTMQIDWAALEQSFPNLTRRYGVARDGIFLQGTAEFLPVKDLFFDTVHMRSCLDHFTAPHVALAEAYRVLKPNGKVVVGIALEGMYSKAEPPVADGSRSAMRRVYRTGLAVLKEHPQIFSVVNQVRSRVAGHHDHHVFHPTRESLEALVTSAGFRIEQEVWPKAYHNVLYLAARKVSPAAAVESGTS